MARVIITHSLEEEINKRFKKDSVKVFELLRSLEDNPKKGKELGRAGGLAIKELKHAVYRFYFIADSFKIKFLKSGELADLLIKFVRMSDKDNQQKIINEIKRILQKLGSEGFG